VLPAVALLGAGILSSTKIGFGGRSSSLTIWGSRIVVAERAVQKRVSETAVIERYTVPESVCNGSQRHSGLAGLLPMISAHSSILTLGDRGQAPAHSVPTAAPVGRTGTTGQGRETARRRFLAELEQQVRDADEGASTLTRRWRTRWICRRCRNRR
jgi:hypothetical protein